MNIQHFDQGWEPQLGHLAVYQVFAAIIMQSFWYGFNYVWGGKIHQSFEGFLQTFET